MESLFQEVASNMKEGGKITIDTAVKWMKEAKLIDDDRVTEKKAREELRGEGETIDCKKFEEAIKKIVELSKQTAEEVHRKMEEAKPHVIAAMEAGASSVERSYVDTVDQLSSQMENLFKEVADKMKEDGKMTVDGAVKWMKEAKIIDEKQVTEENARDAMKGMGNEINYKQFEEALKKIGDSSKQTAEQLQKKLEEVKPQILSVLEAGVSAISKAIEQAKK